jgi:hypothetical protein
MPSASNVSNNTTMSKARHAKDEDDAKAGRRKGDGTLLEVLRLASYRPARAGIRFGMRALAAEARF